MKERALTYEEFIALAKLRHSTKRRKNGQSPRQLRKENGNHEEAEHHLRHRRDRER